MHVKGYAAPETKAAVERARLLIEQAEALGEPPEDPLVLFSVLYGFFAANYVAFNGDVICDLAAQFLTLAEKQGTTAALMVGHRLMGASLVHTGDIAQGRAHYDQALALFDPAEHRLLATRFGQDIGVMTCKLPVVGRWLLGYPDAALADTGDALKDAREIGQAATLMFALLNGSFTHMLCGDHAAANAEADELFALADEKAALPGRRVGMSMQGCLRALTGKASDAIHMITSGITAFGQREQHSGRRYTCPIWLELMRHSANSMMLGAASAKR